MAKSLKQSEKLSRELEKLKSKIDRTKEWVAGAKASVVASAKGTSARAKAQEKLDNHKGNLVDLVAQAAELKDSIKSAKEEEREEKAQLKAA